MQLVNGQIPKRKDKIQIKSRKGKAIIYRFVYVFSSRVIMLALSRKKGESIILNNDIELTILEVKGDQVKIGVNAPKSVPVYRKEVYLQIQQENREAAVEYARQSLKELLKQ